jgi:hypothetical protein
MVFRPKIGGLPYLFILLIQLIYDQLILSDLREKNGNCGNPEDENHAGGP